MRYNWVDLQWQYEWRGPVIQNIRILVCKPCLDIPQEQLRAIVVPADPVPIINARPQDFEIAESDYRSVSAPTVYDPVTGIPIPSKTLRVTEDCQNRTVYPIGIPSGEIQNAVMPYNAATHTPYGVPLQLLSVISNGTATVQVTCSKPHGLKSENQVSIQGLLNRAANGFYSVCVLGATTFTYMTYGSIPAASLLTPTSRIITALIGLPRGYKVIPKLDGPALSIAGQNICFLETESGGSFLLENGSGYIQLESCNQPPAVCFLTEEDGTSMFLLESGTGYIQLETCNPAPPTVCFLDQEDGVSMFLLEDSSGYIQLENCNQAPATYLFELESGSGSLLLEDGSDFLELEDGP
jgi:hypothetical protein